MDESNIEGLKSVMDTNEERQRWQLLERDRGHGHLDWAVQTPDGIIECPSWEIASSIVGWQARASQEPRPHWPACVVCHRAHDPANNCEDVREPRPASGELRERAERVADQILIQLPYHALWKEATHTFRTVIAHSLAAFAASERGGQEPDWLTIATMLCLNADIEHNGEQVLPGELAKYLADIHKQCMEPPLGDAAGSGKCNNEFILRHGYFCELPKGHTGAHGSTCPNPQYWQSWSDEVGHSAPESVKGETNARTPQASTMGKSEETIIKGILETAQSEVGPQAANRQVAGALTTAPAQGARVIDLSKEVVELAGRKWVTVKSAEAYAAHVTAAKAAEIEHLRRALAQYGTHKSNCKFYQIRANVQCTCGLRVALGMEASHEQ